MPVSSKDKSITEKPIEKDKWSGNKFQYSFRQLLYQKPFRISQVPVPSLVLAEEVNSNAGEVPEATPAATKAEQALSADVQKLIIQLATNLWRINNKVGSVDDPDKNTRSVQRHTQASLDALTNGKVEVKDHTNQKYIPGMALDVLAFQPDPFVQDEIISETIKPSIYYQDQLIQRGEVVVLMPKKQDQ